MYRSTTLPDTGPTSPSRTTTTRGLLAALCLAPVLAWAGEPLLVEKSATFDASPERIWQLTGSFDSLAAWHPAVTKVEIIAGHNNRKGAKRLVTLKDGATITEELLTHRPATKTLRYRILASPLPVKDYVSTYHVAAEGKGSRVTWSSRFQADPAAKVDDAKAKEIVGGIYDAGFKGIQDKLAQP
jgi:mxaD protein